MPEDTKSPKLTRKDFLRAGTLGALGLGLGLPESGVSQESGGKRAKVVLARKAEAMSAEGQQEPKVMDSLLSEALTALTGEKSAVDAVRHFVSPADTVGVKM
ncbi:MAG: hypothetical protein JXQ83_09275, partial [Candidatus Glassbacteria bacterium]|nr:hypothetical protein [Candidatus Glassbacteria bacterium]